MPQAPLGGVVLRWHGWVGHKSEQFLDEAFNAPTELAPECQGVIKKGPTQGQHFSSCANWARRPSCAWGVTRVLGLSVELMDCLGPLGQAGVFWVQPFQVMDVPQQVGPAPLLEPRVMVIGGVEIAHHHPAEGPTQHFIYQHP
jgi:hypothetical protein